MVVRRLLGPPGSGNNAARRKSGLHQEHGQRRHLKVDRHVAHLTHEKHRCRGHEQELRLQIAERDGLEKPVNQRHGSRDYQLVIFEDLNQLDHVHVKLAEPPAFIGLANPYEMLSLISQGREKGPGRSRTLTRSTMALGRSLFQTITH